MPHSSKKQRLDDHQGAVASSNEFVATFDDLGVDVLANILAFLSLQNIMRSRRINKKSREAVRNTIVPLTDFRVDSVDDYNAMAVMTRAMPNLQQMKIGRLGYGHKYSDGEDPDEEEAARDYAILWRSHDIEIISNFSKLRILGIYGGAKTGFNGRYPFLFSSFPILEELTLEWCRYLKWDLNMLAALPLLKNLKCEHNSYMTGSINSLRVLKDTLEKVNLYRCDKVEGNFMDLADFPHLKELELYETAVTGDIRDIGENDFTTLERLALPHGVYGGHGYKFQRISDAPDVVRSVFLFKKQRPALKMGDWYGKLSSDSPDRYESVDEDEDDDEALPFHTCFVGAGSRVGYRWENIDGTNPCEVNWLDPEPDRDSSDYEKYIEELQKIQGEVCMYEGFRQPPTEEEYNALVAFWEQIDNEIDV